MYRGAHTSNFRGEGHCVARKAGVARGAWSALTDELKTWRRWHLNLAQEQSLCNNAARPNCRTEPPLTLTERWTIADETLLSPTHWSRMKRILARLKSKTTAHRAASCDTKWFITHAMQLLSGPCIFEFSETDIFGFEVCQNLHMCERQAPMIFDFLLEVAVGHQTKKYWQ
jgi:hypothetical protein